MVAPRVKQVCNHKLLSIKLLKSAKMEATRGCKRVQMGVKVACVHKKAHLTGEPFLNYPYIC